MELEPEVRRGLNSNLKHLIVGLELKTALINLHHHRGPRDRSVLFEPYFQNLILEFCVASFSVLEGLGSAHWLRQNGHDGGNAPRINRDQWLPALCAVYDETGEFGLHDAVERTLSVRDKLHQDRLGARENIDWHALSYEAPSCRRATRFVSCSAARPMRSRTRRTCTGSQRDQGGLPCAHSLGWGPGGSGLEAIEGQATVIHFR